MIEPLFNKVVGFHVCILIKKCLPVKFVKFLSTSIFYRRPPAAQIFPKHRRFSKMFNLITIITNYSSMKNMKELVTEAVAQRCSIKKVFLKMSQNSHEST